jgi:putative restriction endonuclease
MSYLQLSLVKKSGYDCGFEHVLSESEASVTLGSARHAAVLEVAIDGGQINVVVTKGNALLESELQRDFVLTQVGFSCVAESQLRNLLRRAAELAQSLPNQAQSDFEQSLAKEFAKLPPSIKGTEIEVMVRQRVGQQAFRGAMLDYWGGACAVTGIAVPEVLRASHAKPWAECDTDAERLDVFNGFLLSANLDALFDRFLISFDTSGQLLVSNGLPESEVNRLGLNGSLRLRWLAKEHEKYLDHHRVLFQEREASH